MYDLVVQETEQSSNQESQQPILDSYPVILRTAAVLEITAFHVPPCGDECALVTFHHRSSSEGRSHALSDVTCGRRAMASDASECAR